MAVIYMRISKTLWLPPRMLEDQEERLEKLKNALEISWRGSKEEILTDFVVYIISIIKFFGPDFWLKSVLDSRSSANYREISF